MERDIEMLIRQKVMDAERQPVAWRKEQVWMKVNSGMPRENKRRVYLYYAAAACITILMTMFLYLSTAPENDPAARPASSHHPATQERKDHKSLVLPEPMPAENRVARVRKRNTVVQESIHPQLSERVSEISSQPLNADTLAPTPSVAEVTSREKVDRIKPVIGVFEESEPLPEIIGYKKRKGLRWFKSEIEKSNPFEDQPKTIIARIH